MMKKIVSIIVVGVLLMVGLRAVALPDEVSQEQ